MNSKLKKILNSFEATVSVLCLASLIIILAAGVFSRYVLNDSISWVEEISLALFIIFIFSGATRATTTDKHIKILLIYKYFSDKGKIILTIISNVIFFATMVIILFGFYPIFSNLVKYKTVMAVTGIPKAVPYGLVVFFIILMLVRLIQCTIKLVKEYKGLNKQNTMNN